MRFGFLPLFGLLAISPTLPAAAAQPATAEGKSDFVQAPVLVADGEAFATAVLQDGVSDLRGLTIEPAFAPADAEDFIAYNLERLDVSELGPYDLATFGDQAAAIPWDIAAAFAAVSYIGVTNWRWGSTSFRFNNEGWFGKDIGSMGMDKLGHAFTAYAMTEYFTQRIAHSTDDRAGAALTGALLGMGVQTYVEIFDGFSGDHGFSYEDMVMDGLGAGFSVLRSSIPGMAEKVDFRMEYLPSGNAGAFAPMSDYSGQKFVLALKLSGFEDLEDTPLRFVELQAGYYARGFTKAERERNETRRREPYLGIGFNLQELLDMGAAHDNVAALGARRLLEYVQVPYTYVPTKRD